MWVHLTLKSGNGKVGPIAVSTTEKASCPSECSLRDGDCYARFGPVGIHWNKVSKKERGDNWTAFCRRMRKILPGSLFRHNQAGDLPQNKQKKIHKGKLRQLVGAVCHLKGWTYTHYNPEDKHNAEAIAYANLNGFTVNLSSDNLEQADKYIELGIGPVTTLLPTNAPTTSIKTPAGNTVVPCLAQIYDDMTCEKCKLCQVVDRKSIVGFYAHGTAKKRLSKRLSE